MESSLLVGFPGTTEVLPTALGPNVLHDVGVQVGLRLFLLGLFSLRDLLRRLLFDLHRYRLFFDGLQVPGRWFQLTEREVPREVHWQKPASSPLVTQSDVLGPWLDWQRLPGQH